MGLGIFKEFEQLSKKVCLCLAIGGVRGGPCIKYAWSMRYDPSKEESVFALFSFGFFFETGA